MSETDVQAIRRDLNELRDVVHGWGEKIDLMHKAVLKMSRKVYVPGPPSGISKSRSQKAR